MGENTLRTRTLTLTFLWLGTTPSPRGRSRCGESGVVREAPFRIIAFDYFSAVKVGQEPSIVVPELHRIWYDDADAMKLRFPEIVVWRFGHGNPLCVSDRFVGTLCTVVPSPTNSIGDPLALFAAGAFAVEYPFVFLDPRSHEFLDGNTVELSKLEY